MTRIKQKLLLLVPAALFAVLIAVLAISLGGSPDARSSGREGDDVPDYTFELLQSQGTFNPRQYAGKAYFINFFASWCVPCRFEHPVLSKLAQEQGIPIIGIAYKDERKDSIAMLTASGNPYFLVAGDPTGRGGIEWGLRGVPETFLIARDGTIAWHYAGPITPQVVIDDLMPAWQDVKSP